jgi:hypothetical protein
MVLMICGDTGSTFSKKGLSRVAREARGVEHPALALEIVTRGAAE